MAIVSGQHLIPTPELRLAFNEYYNSSLTDAEFGKIVEDGNQKDRVRQSNSIFGPVLHRLAFQRFKASVVDRCEKIRKRKLEKAELDALEEEMAKLGWPEPDFGSFAKRMVSFAEVDSNYAWLAEAAAKAELKKYFDQAFAGTRNRRIDPNTSTEDLAHLRNRVHYALKGSLGTKNLALSQVVNEYVREKEAGRAPVAVAIKPASSGLDSDKAKNTRNDNVAPSGPFAWVSDLLNGDMLPDPWKKFLGALISPLLTDTGEEPQSSTPSNTNDNPANPSVGKQWSFLDIFLKGIPMFVDLFTKAIKGIVGTKPIIDELQNQAEGQRNPARDLTASELRSDPNGPIFQEYVKDFHDDNVKGRLNSLWRDNIIPKPAAMDELHLALQDAGKKDDLEFFNFKRALLPFADSNSGFRRNLMQQWHEQVYNQRSVQNKVDLDKREDNKARLIRQLDDALAHQNRSSATLGSQFGTAATAMATAGVSATDTKDLKDAKDSHDLFHFATPGATTSSVPSSAISISPVTLPLTYSASAMGIGGGTSPGSPKAVNKSGASASGVNTGPNPHIQWLRSNAARPAP